MTPFLRLSLLASAALGLTTLPALAQVPSVVTDIPAVGALVAQVMGDLGTPTVLMDAGGDPHHYQLRPSQARNLQDADLLVWIGPELAPWLVRPSEGLAKGASLPLLAVPQTQLHHYAGDGHEGHGHEDHGHGHDHDSHAHGHEHGHDHTHGDHDHSHNHGHAHSDHDHSGHDHSGTDPHAWLNPVNGQIWLKAIAADLAQRDPENAATYQANADKAVTELAALDTELKATLEPAKGKHFVVFHDAYGYFTRHYGLEAAIPVSIGDASTPSAARLKKIQAQITDSGAACAFPEANHDAKLLHVAIEGTDAREGAALDPEGSAGGEGAELYANILRNMGKAFADCLAG